MPFQIIEVFSEEQLKFAQQSITRTVNYIEEFRHSIKTSPLLYLIASLHSFTLLIYLLISPCLQCLLFFFFSLFFYESPLLTIDQILYFL